MNLATRLTETRKSLGYSQRELAHLSGVSQQMISKLETGNAEGTRDIVALARALNITAHWLQTGEGDKERTTVSTGLDSLIVLGDNQRLEHVALRHIPLLSWVQAGHWEEAIQGGEEKIAVAGNFSENAYALTVRGDSMQPKFPDGCQIVVEPRVTAETGNFVVVLLEDSNEAMFKQFVRDGDRIYLKALNPDYGTRLVDKPMTICGVVCKLVMDV